MYLSAEMGKRAVNAWKQRKGPYASTGPLPAPAAPDAGAGPAASLESLETYPQRVAAEPAGVARNIVRSFVLVVLPLLLIAAAIEGFITPHLR
jgi:hypothetical protein